MPRATSLVGHPSGRRARLVRAEPGPGHRLWLSVRDSPKWGGSGLGALWRERGWPRGEAARGHVSAVGRSRPPLAGLIGGHTSEGYNRSWSPSRLPRPRGNADLVAESAPGRLEHVEFVRDVKADLPLRMIEYHSRLRRCRCAARRRDDPVITNLPGVRSQSTSALSAQNSSGSSCTSSTTSVRTPRRRKARWVELGSLAGRDVVERHELIGARVGEVVHEGHLADLTSAIYRDDRGVG